MQFYNYAGVLGTEVDFICEALKDLPIVVRWSHTSTIFGYQIGKYISCGVPKFFRYPISYVRSNEVVAFQDASQLFCFLTLHEVFHYFGHQHQLCSDMALGVINEVKKDFNKAISLFRQLSN